MLFQVTSIRKDSNQFSPYLSIKMILLGLPVVKNIILRNDFSKEALRHPLHDYHIMSCDVYRIQGTIQLNYQV